jgi:hypothetical protein
MTRTSIHTRRRRRSETASDRAGADQETACPVAENGADLAEPALSDSIDAVAFLTAIWSQLPLYVQPKMNIALIV